MLHVDSVTAGYGAISVLKAISLRVAEGEIVTLIGGNGAGKTTTLNVICGVVPVRSGKVVFGGRSITGQSPNAVVRLGMAHSPEGRKIFPRMTVLENLEMGAFTRNDKAGITSDLERSFALFPILGERKHQLGGTLSGGEQQMLAVARALMSRPKLLLLDEPSLGLAPLIVARIFEVVKELNRGGVTVLLVEQNARTALRLAHRGYVIETGEITMEGQASALLADERVQKAYLGE
ncbi:MAG: ABC transporter ATP-binding protein [Myxococcales bacterium]|nr:ABC transporter ATP-binding protein [Myxococcales bacterium]